MIKETLEATRSQLIAALQVLDLALAELDTPQEGPCQHQGKVDVATFGLPGRWYCPACQAEGTTDPQSPVAQGGV